MSALMLAPCLFMLAQAPVITLDGAGKEQKKEGKRRVLRSCDLFNVLKFENGAVGSFASGENKCGEEAVSTHTHTHTTQSADLQSRKPLVAG